MSALGHLKALCCLDLPLEAALIAISSLVREVVPADWTRIGLNDETGAPTVGFGEHPDFLPLFFATYDELSTDPTSIYAVFIEGWAKGTVGASLNRQGADYLRSRHFTILERPLGSCWLLDAMLHDGSRPVGSMALSRHRSMKPFDASDVRRLDEARPWIAHALGKASRTPTPLDAAPDTFVASACRRATLMLDANDRVVLQSAGAESLLYMLDGTADDWRAKLGKRSPVPPVIRTVLADLRRLPRHLDGGLPRRIVPTRWGALSIEAGVLLPPGVDPVDAARKPPTEPVSVTMELHEHRTAHAARVLRLVGATPAQVRVGVLLTEGKSRAEIAKRLGIRSSSVVDATRKLYDRLEVRNAAQLATRLSSLYQR